MTETLTDAPKTGPGLGDYIHVVASLAALALGGAMYFYGWAKHAFAGLMIVSAVSAVIISWRTDSWVTGHYLAMAPVLGVGGGYLSIPGAFTFAYLCLWLAFAHFVRRGIQAARASKGR
jgi:hypothetical protein